MKNQELNKRFSALPEDLKLIFLEDITIAMENRISVLEREAERRDNKKHWEKKEKVS